MNSHSRKLIKDMRKDYLRTMRELREGRLDAPRETMRLAQEAVDRKPADPGWIDRVSADVSKLSD